MVTITPNAAAKLKELMVQENQGTEIDHNGNLLEGFVFNNPNVKNGCGCGTSFELK